jgi:predicted NUDIX family NTP pyrophosphohydrolase
MASRTSAGILLHRVHDGRRQTLLGHMGGPFWSKKDAGAWTIPKGEHTPDEDPFATALREFEEELGLPVPATEFVELGSFRQRGGKVVTIWAAEGDLDPTVCTSNTFAMEWPPGSGRTAEFPEIDRADWFDIEVAREKVVAGQVAAIDRLLELLGEDGSARRT